MISDYPMLMVDIAGRSSLTKKIRHLGTAINLIQEITDAKHVAVAGLGSLPSIRNRYFSEGYYCTYGKRSACRFRVNSVR